MRSKSKRNYSSESVEVKRCLLSKLIKYIYNAASVTRITGLRGLTVVEKLALGDIK